MFLAGRTDFSDDVGDTFDTGNHLIHRIAGLFDQRAAGIDLGDRIIDQQLDFLGRGRRALCQTAHLRRDDREATALLACTRGFDRCIECQDIGLEGNPVNHTDDVDNLARRIIDRAHRGHDFADDIATCNCYFRGRHGQLIGLSCVVGILLDGRGQLFHCRCGFFNRTGLLLGARGEIKIARGNLA